MKGPKIFGGALLKNSHPKGKRPISTKHAMHIVIRSSHVKGRGFRAPPNEKAIDRILKDQAKNFGIRLYRYENVGNHLHLLLKTSHRTLLARFLRAITGLIARTVLGAERGKAKSIQFWDGRPFSRIVTWGRDYRSIHRYFDKNRIQAVGFSLLTLERELEAMQSDSG